MKQLRYSSHIVNVPLKVLINTYKRGAKAGKENWFYLNLNIYRNCDFFTLNKAKILFKESIKDQLDKIPEMRNKEIAIKYTLFTQTKRRLDISNICCIVDKFFCDCLTENNLILDDSYEYLKNVHYTYGGVDKLNPRVQIEIRSRCHEDDNSI